MIVSKRNGSMSEDSPVLVQTEAVRIFLWTVDQMHKVLSL